MNAQTKKLIAWVIGVALVLVAAYFDVKYPIPPMPTDEDLAAASGNVTQVRALSVLNDTTIGGNLSVGGATSLTGNVASSGNIVTTATVQAGLLRQGSNYPVVNATPGKEFASGLIAGPVQVATVPASAHGLATVEAVQCYPGSPLATGAWGCIAKVGTNNQITTTLVTLAATPVPTASYGSIRWLAAGK